MKFTRIKETCIYVTDLQRTKEFYVDKLGLSLISIAAGRHIFFRAGESVLLCFIADVTRKETIVPPHGASAGVHFAFEVERQDYDEAIQEIEKAGIQIIHHHNWKGGIRSFYFHDPDGNVVEILEEGMWEV